MKTLAKMTAAVAITVASLAAQADLSNTRLETVSLGTKVKIERDIYLPAPANSSLWGGHTFSEGVMNGSNDSNETTFCRVRQDAGQNVLLKKGSELTIVSNEVFAADGGSLKMIEGNRNTILLKSKKGNYLSLLCQTWTNYQPEDSLIMARSNTINVTEFQRAFGKYLTLKMSRPAKF